MDGPVILVVVVGLSDRAAAARTTRSVSCDWGQLTEREKAVARLAAQAMTNQQIARRLGITTHTVNFHLRQIFIKLKIDSRVSLARLVDPPFDG